MKGSIFSFLAVLSCTLQGILAGPMALPEHGGGRNGHGSKCVSDAQAADLVQKMQDLYHCMDADLAKKTLTKDFVSYSYTLLRLLSGQPTVEDGANVYASSRQEFITKQLASNEFTCNEPPFRTYKIWNGCNIVGFWWSFKSGPDAPQAVEFVGIDILEIDVNSGKIKADYSEYSY